MLTRRAIDAARRAMRDGASCPSLDEVALAVASAAEASLSARARSVINATGVVLHTNLGRAPLSRRAVEALATSAGRYTSIEIDLATGRRGARRAFAERALAQLTGAEAALVVNNNAAATLLALGALAMGKRVLVSRGELIEIGGGFRVPDVCARSGAHLVEVGTTNRTRLDDYERALAEGGVAAILRVHQGNFRQVGFVERPELAALAALAHAHGALLIEDLGGGALIDFAPYGLRGEPSRRRASRPAATWSASAPTRSSAARRAASSPVAPRPWSAPAAIRSRAPSASAASPRGAGGDAGLVPRRVARRDPRARGGARPLARVRERAEAWRQALASRGVAAEIVPLDAAMGGGTLAEASLASCGVALDGDAERLAALLRAGDPAVVARIHEGRLLFDARTVLPDEDEALLAAIGAARSQLDRD